MLIFGILYLYSISETSDRTKDNINVCQSSTSTSESNTDSSVTVSEATVLLRTYIHVYSINTTKIYIHKIRMLH